MTSEKLAEQIVSRRAVATTLSESRATVIFGAWVTAGTAMGLYYVALFMRDMPDWVNVALGLVVVVFLGFALALHFVGPRWTYRLVVAWVTLVQAVIVLQLANMHFGAERHLIANGTVPLLTVVVSVTLIGSRCYLASDTSRVLNLIFILALMVITGTHAALNWSVAPTKYAIVTSLVTAYLVAPLTEILMAQYDRVQTRISAALSEAAHAAQQRAAAAEKRANTDDLTGFLSRAGIQQQLSQAFEANERTGVARICILDEHQLEGRMEPAAWQELLRTMASALGQVLGADFGLGRIDDSQFVVWVDRADSEANWEELMDAAAAQVKEILEEGGHKLELSVGASDWLRGSDVGFALEDTSFRGFMRADEAV